MDINEQLIKDRLANLPDCPFGLNAMMRQGDFHGIVEWETKGSMRSWKALNHKNAEAYHTIFSPNTEVTWHTHGFESKEIIVCLEGDLVIIYEDGTRKVLNEKDIIIIEKQVKHMAISGNKPCQILAITVPKENGKCTTV